MSGYAEEEEGLRHLEEQAAQEACESAEWERALHETAWETREEVMADPQKAHYLLAELLLMAGCKSIFDLPRHLIQKPGVWK